MELSSKENTMEKVTRIEDIKELKGKINGQPASMFKIEDTTKELHSILDHLGYEQSANYYYKVVNRDSWKGWEMEIKDKIINAVLDEKSYASFNFEGEYGMLIPEKKAKHIMLISTVEDLNRIANITLSL